MGVCTKCKKRTKLFCYVHKTHICEACLCGNCWPSKTKERKTIGKHRMQQIAQPNHMSATGSCVYSYNALYMMQLSSLLSMCVSHVRYPHAHSISASIARHQSIPVSQIRHSSSVGVGDVMTYDDSIQNRIPSPFTAPVPSQRQETNACPTVW